MKTKIVMPDAAEDGLVRIECVSQGRLFDVLNWDDGACLRLKHYGGQHRYLHIASGTIHYTNGGTLVRPWSREFDLTPPPKPEPVLVSVGNLPDDAVIRCKGDRGVVVVVREQIGVYVRFESPRGLEWLQWHAKVEHLGTMGEVTFDGFVGKDPGQ